MAVYASRAPKREGSIGMPDDAVVHHVSKGGSMNGPSPADDLRSMLLSGQFDAQKFSSLAQKLADDPSAIASIMNSPDLAKKFEDFMKKNADQIKSLADNNPAIQNVLEKVQEFAAKPQGPGADPEMAAAFRQDRGTSRVARHAPGAAFS